MIYSQKRSQFKRENIFEFLKGQFELYIVQSWILHLCFVIESAVVLYYVTIYTKDSPQSLATMIASYLSFLNVM